MKPLMFFLVLILSSFVCASPVSAASDYEDGVKELTKAIVAEAGKLHKQNLAVVDFTDLQGNVTALGRFLAEELSASLVMAGGIQVVDRNQLNKIFQEHSLSMLGISDPAAIKKVGKVAGADALITGSITEMADSVRVTAKVLATDTARVIAAAKTTIPKTGTIAELVKQGIEASGAKTSEKNQDEPALVSKTAPAHTTMKVEVSNFIFVLQECRREGMQVTCSLLITNEAEDKELQLFGTWSTKLFDTNGNVFDASGARLGNQEGSGPQLRLISKVPTRAGLRFDKVGSDTNGIAILEVGFFVTGKGQASAQFRDVPLSQ